MRPGARQTLLAALDQGYADPSRRYHVARQSRRLLDGARESIAAIIGARPDEVSFATSGTQAVHLAVTGLAQGRQRIGRRLLVSAVEHSCVIHAARAVPEGNVEELSVDSHAVVEPGAVSAQLRVATTSAIGADLGVLHRASTKTVVVTTTFALEVALRV